MRDADPDSDRVPLLFLPGAGGTGDVFYRTIYALKDARRVMTLRYPAVSEPVLIVSGLISLLAKVGVGQVDLAGSSLGGYIAQAIAIDQPGLVRHALFGNTFFDASWLQAKLSRDEVLSTPPADHLARTIAKLSGLPESSPEQADYKSTMLALIGPEQTGDMAVAALAAVLGTTPCKAVDMPQGRCSVIVARTGITVNRICSTRFSVRCSA